MNKGPANTATDNHMHSMRWAIARWSVYLAASACLSYTVAIGCFWYALAQPRTPAGFGSNSVFRFDEDPSFGGLHRYFSSGDKSNHLKQEDLGTDVQVESWSQFPSVELECSDDFGEWSVGWPMYCCNGGIVIKTDPHYDRANWVMRSPGLLLGESTTGTFAVPNTFFIGLPLRVQWGGFIVNTLFYFVVLSVPMFLRRNWLRCRHWWRRKTSRCPFCNYQLALDADAAKCTECGRDPKVIWQSRGRRWLFGGIVLMLPMLVGIGWAAVRCVNHPFIAPVHYAARTGEVAALEQCLRDGEDVDRYYHYVGMTPLKMATVSGQRAFVEALVENNARVSDPGSAEMTGLLLLAIESEAISMVEYWLERGADPTQFATDHRNALVEAVRTEDLEIVKLTLEFLPPDCDMNDPAMHQCILQVGATTRNDTVLRLFEGDSVAGFCHLSFIDEETRQLLLLNALVEPLSRLEGLRFPGQGSRIYRLLSQGVRLNPSEEQFSSVVERLNINPDIKRVAVENGFNLER